MTTISVIEFGEKKLFNCDGVRFQDRFLSVRRFGDRESGVDILRNGELVESGSIRYVKTREDSSELVPRFVGLKSTDRWRKCTNGFSDFQLDDFDVGDVIVIHAFPERKFLTQLLSNGLLRGRGAYFTHLHLDEYPYPDDWRESPEKVKRTWKKKLARYEADLRATGIAYISDSFATPAPIIKDCSFDITICEVDGKKYFSCQGVRFNLLPTLNVFYDNHHEIEVYSADAVDPIVKISIYTVGKCDTTIFECSGEWGKRLFGTQGWAPFLTADNFDVDHRLKLCSNIEYNLLRELALHFGSWRFIPELKKWLDILLVVDEHVNQIDCPEGLREDVRNYFGRVVDRELTKLLQGKRIEALTVLSGY